MSEVWYKDGLRFTCTRCGDCCTGAPGFVWVDDQEIAALAEFLGLPMEEVRQAHTKATSRGRSLREKVNGDCIYYDREGRGCGVYPVRPRQCRTWPFWESNVATPEQWQATCEVCPGSGKGELFSVEQILERVRTIPM